MKNNVNVEHLYELPANVYWKDTKGIYRGCNDFVAQNACGGRSQDMIGTTDDDYLWRVNAPVYRCNDTKVLKNNTAITTIEMCTLYNNECVPVLSHKTPLYSASQKLVGVLGISFLMNNNNFINQLPNGLKFSLDIANFKINVLSELMLNHDTQLSSREIEIVQQLMRGKTAKNIADICFISRRTVEQHIQNIKNKFGVTTKAELIEKVLEGF